MRVIFHSFLLLGLLFPVGAIAGQAGPSSPNGPAGYPVGPGGYGYLGGPGGYPFGAWANPGQYQEWLKRGRQDIKDPYNVTEAEDQGIPVEEFSPCWRMRQNWSTAPCPALDRLCTDRSRCPR